MVGVDLFGQTLKWFRKSVWELWGVVTIGNVSGGFVTYLASPPLAP